MPLPKPVEALIEAVEDLDDLQVRRLSVEVAAAVRGRRLSLTAVAAGQALQALSRKRYFAAGEEVGAALLDSGRGTGLWWHYAQCLIEQKKLVGALAVLERVEKASEAGSGDHGRARGMMARVYKQHFVDSAAADGVVAPHAREALVRSAGLYHDVFVRDASKLWHGINAVALAARAQADGIRLPVRVDVKATARMILAAVAAMGGRAAAFDLATAIEACVALRDWRGALRWARTYVGHGQTDAFEVGSTLRQLTEVWRLPLDRAAAGPTFALLKSKLLASEGGEVHLSTAGERRALRAAAAELEAVFGSEDMFPVRQLQTALERCRSVALITRKSGDGFGTAFVVSAAELGLPSRELLLLTNSHVVSQDLKEHRTLAAKEPYRPPLRPDEASVRFSLKDGGALTGVKKVLWASPHDRLDATLLRLERPIDRDDHPPCPLDGLSGRPAGRPKRVFVVGHPEGGELSVSLSDSKVLGCRAPRLHYRTPTRGGSSGSPVFTEGWKVLALHHAGSDHMAPLRGKEPYAANEGILIEAIRRDLASGAPGGRPSRR